MGGKPSKGTPKDMRLKRNRKPAGRPPFSTPSKAPRSVPKPAKKG
jgi:hypothetical protein